MDPTVQLRGRMNYFDTVDMVKSYKSIRTFQENLILSSLYLDEQLLINFLHTFLR